MGARALKTVGGALSPAVEDCIRSVHGRARVAVALLCAVVACACAAPAAAATATATTVTQAPAEAAPGLPEGRGYELVSPARKHGDEGGFSLSAAELGSPTLFSVASASGKRIMYAAAAPVGSTATAAETFAVSEQLATGAWETRSALPPIVGIPKIGEYGANWLLPSSDLTNFAFTSVQAYVGAGSKFRDRPHSPNVYRTQGTSENPALGAEREPLWLSEPLITEPVPALGDFLEAGRLNIVGGTPNLSTVYFNYGGTLVPEDGSREPEAIGFYEWSEGQLRNAGELAEGGFSPSGAEGADAYGGTDPIIGPAIYANQVSRDGTHAFFVSESPVTEQRELYVREPAPEGGKRNVIASRDQLQQEEEEASTHKAVAPIPAPSSPELCNERVMYASPNGTRVFFDDVARLTAAAPEGSAEKVYEFNTATEKLTYMPGVAFGTRPATECGVVAASADGSTLLYMNSKSLLKLPIDVWHENAQGEQSITKVMVTTKYSGGRRVAFGRASANGNVFVFGAKGYFAAEEPSAGSPALQSSPKYIEIYRYDATTGVVECISCAQGEAPSGNAILSNDEENEIVSPTRLAGTNVLQTAIGTTRGINEEGTEVFFQSTQPLVKGASNGTQNVYEWREGRPGSEGELSLISTGTSSEPSYVLDNSASGESVFFATAQPLSARDTEGGYDVYDARVGGAEPYEATVARCSTSCRSANTLATETPTLATASSGPSGNLAAPVGSKKAPETMRSTAKRRKHKLAQCRHRAKRRHNRRKRARALRRCARRYGGRAKGASHHRQSHGTTHKHTHRSNRRRG